MGKTAILLDVAKTVVSVAANHPSAKKDPRVAQGLKMANQVLNKDSGSGVANTKQGSRASPSSNGTASGTDGMPSSSEIFKVARDVVQMYKDKKAKQKA
jgi:hypothetical protein